MNTTIIIIVTLIIITLIIKYITTHNQEDFTNDEAIQNVASLYNQAKLSVTDFTSTGTSTLNTLVVNNGATINAVSTINDIRTNGITNRGVTSTDTLGVANGGVINGLTQLNTVKVGYNVDAGQDINVGRNLNVTGTITSNKIPVIPIVVSNLNLGTSWGWDDQIWGNSGITNIVFPIISERLRPLPIGSVVIFAITGNSNPGRGQGLIMTYKISDGQYTYSPMQGILRNI